MMAASRATGEPRRERRKNTVPRAPAAVAASRRGSSWGSTGAPTRRRRPGSTAIDSARRARPRTTGTRVSSSWPGSRVLSPEYTAIRPSGLRTAAAQRRSLCSITPSRRAMPPRCRAAGREAGVAAFACGCGGASSTVVIVCVIGIVSSLRQRQSSATRYLGDEWSPSRTWPTRPIDGAATACRPPGGKPPARRPRVPRCSILTSISPPTPP